MRALIEVLGEHRWTWRAVTPERLGLACECGDWLVGYPEIVMKLDLHEAHLAEVVHACLADVAGDAEVRDAMAERISWDGGDLTRYSDAATDDHNRWSWRGDGHGSAINGEYRRQADAALSAFLAALGTRSPSEPPDAGERLGGAETGTLAGGGGLG